MIFESKYELYEFHLAPQFTMEHLQVPKKMGKWAAWESGESEKGELGMLAWN